MNGGTTINVVTLNFLKKGIFSMNERIDPHVLNVFHLNTSQIDFFIKFRQRHHFNTMDNCSNNSKASKYVRSWCDTQTAFV